MPDRDISSYGFYAASLRFVAAKLDGAGDADPRSRAMVAVLRRAADSVDAGVSPLIAADGLELAARAFAGFAAFLQKQILPEAVAHANTIGESQIRWSVDTAMAAVNLLLSVAAMPERGDVTVILPPPPGG